MIGERIEGVGRMAKKRFILVILALCLLSLAGCGTAQSTEDPERTNPTPPDIATMEFKTETLDELGITVTYPTEWVYARQTKDTVWLGAKYGDTMDGDMGYQVMITSNPEPVDLELFSKVQVSAFANMNKFEILETGEATIAGEEGRYQIFTWEAVDKNEEPLAQCYANQYYAWFDGYNYIITIFASGKATYDANLELIEHLIAEVEFTGITAAE